MLGCFALSRRTFLVQRPDHEANWELGEDCLRFVHRRPELLTFNFSG